MNDLEVKLKLKRNAQRHIFSRYRSHIRYYGSLVFLSFSLVDYLFKPDLFFEWLSFRVSFVLFVYIMFFFMAKYRAVRVLGTEIAISTIWFACATITWMIFRSGGGHSLYGKGLILVAVMGTQIFRLNRIDSLKANLGVYLPTIIIYFLSFFRGESEFRLVLIQSSFLVGMTLLGYIYGLSDDQIAHRWTKQKKKITDELEVARRTDFLKRHFSPTLRGKIEAGLVSIEKRQLVPNAVVGFADMSASTKIANILSPERDWELKEKFLEVAIKRGTDYGMTILSHQGDGFLFLANFGDLVGWEHNLISFFEHLSYDYEQIVKKFRFELGDITTGVKFGVSCGPVIMGILGNDQSYFTALGRDVNLAARLCDRALPNQIVVSGRIWNTLGRIIRGWIVHEVSFTTLKGFEDQEIPAKCIEPRLIKNSGLACPTCGDRLALISVDGHTDLQCPQGHELSGPIANLADTKEKAVAS